MSEFQRDLASASLAVALNPLQTRSSRERHRILERVAIDHADLIVEEIGRRMAIIDLLREYLPQEPPHV